MLDLLLCLAVAAVAYLLGYHDGKRRGRNELDKILADFGKLARDAFAELTGRKDL